jgi:hypothetical protein
VVIVSTEGGEDGEPVREEDNFDVEAVHAWLAMHAPADAGIGEQCRAPEVRQFSGGASNLTYLLSYGEQEMILRRAPPGAKAASAHDMAREFRIQRALAPATLWGAFIRSGMVYAAIAYSWMRPPSRSCLRIAVADEFAVVGGGCRGSGGASSSERCGLWVL